MTGAGRHSVDNLDVKGPVEDEHEEARTVSGGLMAHSRLSREVDVRPGANDPIAEVELALEDDHGVRCG